LGKLDPRVVPKYNQIAQNLKKTLIFNNGFSPIGLLRSCLDYALNDNLRIGGVFDSLRTQFKVAGGRELFYMVNDINEFRNTYVAHQEKELNDVNQAREQLKKWINGLKLLSTA